jgi:SAM-dependent methyltransferase
MDTYTTTIKEIYEKHLLGIEPQLCTNDIQLLYILAYLSDNRTVHILDAGCGNGRYAIHLVDLGYKHVFGVDLFTKIETDKFQYRQSSIDDLPFQDDVFDFIYSNSVAHYIKNIDKMIKELRRCLKEGGAILITAHTKYSLFSLWRIIQRDILNRNKLAHLQGLTFYSAEEYTKILVRNGFEILLIDGYRLSFFMYPAYCRVANIANKILKIQLPLNTPRVTKHRWLALLKSLLAYHSIIVARKIVS